MTTTVLEAPNLRDDYYCSILAYSASAHVLAVGLGNSVYLWSEATGVRACPSGLDMGNVRSAHVTSIAFSSVQGDCAILAFGRSDGRLTLWSPIDVEDRFLRVALTSSAVHVSFGPKVMRRVSQRHPTLVTEQETLLVGDDFGVISVFFVEWPKSTERDLFGWHGGIALHVRIAVHTQQICGIAWSVDGELFATGGNDNLCCLFESKKILGPQTRGRASSVEIRQIRVVNNHLEIGPSMVSESTIHRDGTKYQWRLNAAVKAIAFCPWQRGLLAAGGGSNDRCIHFYHTVSGASLATIDCAAQVTSLIWSKTRREIVATFGFAQPEHPFRIAVYSWPSCQQVVAIPWHDEMRALFAIAYPGGPHVGRAGREGGTWWSRTAQEGCIVVAGSDGSIKFHEVWCEAKQATGPRRGLIGGSDILESLHGIEKEGLHTIR